MVFVFLNFVEILADTISSLIIQFFEDYNATNSFACEIFTIKVVKNKK